MTLTGCRVENHRSTKQRHCCERVEGALARVLQALAATPLSSTVRVQLGSLVSRWTTVTACTPSGALPLLRMQVLVVWCTRLPLPLRLAATLWTLQVRRTRPRFKSGTSSK